VTRVLFLIRSLEAGGAERQLTELVKSLDPAQFEIAVATFYGGGTLRSVLAREPRVRLFSLDKTGRWDVIHFIFRLIVLIRSEQPDVIHGYMGVANELALFVARLTGARVVWGLRASNMDLSQYTWPSRWMFRIGAALSRFPDCIVVNSEAGKRHYGSRGYYTKNMVVIPNGIDTSSFYSDDESGAQLRTKLGIDPALVIVGLIARLDPMKDHTTFLRAAAIVASRCTNVMFLFAGGGSKVDRKRLQQLAGSLGVADQVVWIGEQRDMRSVYNSCNVVVSSSISEGLPNAIAEAMACGVPCVATDAGDSRLLIGDDTRIVPPGDAESLAAAVLSVLALSEEERRDMGVGSRERVKRLFSIEQLARRTASVLQGELE
jgi:glycosyltransferase involved in cell wall biosynthesis